MTHTAMHLAYCLRGNCRVLEHISFCLDEIECEIESYDVLGLSIVEQLELREHLEQMRTVLDRCVERRQRKIKPGAKDDLTQIRGIDEATADALTAVGIRRFSTIAALTADEVDALAGEGITRERISGEGWIEQAAILATGRLTHFARSRAGVEAPRDRQDVVKVAPAPTPPAEIAAAVVASEALAARSLATPANDPHALPAAPPKSRTPRHAAAVFIAAMITGLQQNGLPGFN